MEALLLPLLLLAVFYFLLIRPQQRQRRQMSEVQSTLTPGAKVMTGAGLIATVKSVTDDQVELEVAPGVTNWYVRRAVVQVIPDEIPDEIPTDGPVFNESGAEPPAPGERDDNGEGGTR